jgi:hypothetical protein
MTKKDETEAEAPKKKTMQTIAKAGMKLPDGMVLQKETAVEYEERGGKRVVVGPKDVRPQTLLGCTLP